MVRKVRKRKNWVKGFSDFISNHPIYFRVGVLSFVIILVVILTAVYQYRFAQTVKTVPPKGNSEAVTQAKNFASQCENENDWRDCYGKLFFSYDRSMTLKDSQNALTELQNIDPKTRDCHILAHKMMQAEVAKNPAGWIDILHKINYTACNYGFIHGIMEGRARFDKTFVVNEKTIPQICDTMKRANPKQGVDTTCSHIFGHLLLAYNFDGTVDSSIGNSVAVCDKLPKALTHECYAGTFMESFTRDNLVDHLLAHYIPWNKETIAHQENICRQYSEPASWGCWQEISHLYNSEFPNNPRKVSAACMNGTTGGDRYYCYMHAVASLINNRGGDKNYFASICRPFIHVERNYFQCMNVAVHSLIFGSIKNIDRAFYFCNSQSANRLSSCYSIVSRTLHQSVSSAQQDQLCNGAPEKYREVCRA